MKWIFILSVLISIPILAQLTISGAVVDSENGSPLVGAVVYIHEVDRGSLTDADGRYLISNLRRATYHLHVSYIGYTSTTKTVKIEEDNILKFSLSPSSIELAEVIVETNHFKAGPREHTLPMEIIDADYLRKNQKGTLINALEVLPGISAINTGVGISKPVIRGMSFNRVIVNDRGIKQEGQQWGTDHGLELDMFDPGRVEVIKGPGSLLYGSDGIGGVINIFPPALPQNELFQGTIQTLYKSNNHLFGTSIMGEGTNGKWVYRGRVSLQDFGDYRVPADQFTYNSFVLDLFDERLKNTAGNERNFSVMGGIKDSWGYSTVTVSNFRQQAGLFSGAIGIPRAFQLVGDGNIRNIELPRQIINHFKIISNSNILVKGNWLEIDLGYQNNDRREESLPHAHGKGPRPEGTLAHGLNLQTWTANARYYHHITEGHNRIFGAQLQYQQNGRSGFEFLLPDFTSFSVGTFVHEEFTWNDAYTLAGGLRFDYGNRNVVSSFEPIYQDIETIYRYYKRNNAMDRDFYNMSGAIGFSWYPNQKLNAKVNLGSSFRIPTAAELSINGIHHGTFRHELGDSTLASERGYQFDFTLSYQLKYLSFVMTPYVSYYQDFIYLAPRATFSSSLDPEAFPEGGQVFQYKQHDAFYGGGELSVDYHPIEEFHLRTSFEYVYNYNFDTRLPLPFTPPGSLYSEAGWESMIPFMNNNWSINFNYRWAFDQNRTDRNEKATPGYHLFGLQTGTELSIGMFKADINIEIQNITDKQYFNHLSRYRLLNLPEQGRNIVLSMLIPIG